MTDVTMPAIVIPAYERPFSLERLLKSLDRAGIPEGTSLVISIEGGGAQALHQVINNTCPDHLDLRIINHPRRLGLKNHILACGDLTDEYDKVILLEDDLAVDHHFYTYAANASDFYATQEQIAGVALYGCEYNEYAELPFRALYNGYSTYFMQVPCSWGQCWTRGQWTYFRDWLETASEKTISANPILPAAVKTWPKTSWKKYFAAYMIETDRYFVYPYQSYSTNCADPGGTHHIYGTDFIQTALGSDNRPVPEFRFCPADNHDVAYDSYMEPCGNSIFDMLGMSKDDVEIDLLGIKPPQLLQMKPYALTCKPVNHFVKQYPRSFRPIERNLTDPLNRPSEHVLSLAKSTDIAGTSLYQRHISEYDYFAGFNLYSKKRVTDYIRHRMKMLARRLFGP